jgi:hypothetical protein
VPPWFRRTNWLSWVEPNDVALEHFEEGLVLSNIMAHRTRGKEKNMLGFGNRSSRVNDQTPKLKKNIIRQVDGMQSTCPANLFCPTFNLEWKLKRQPSIPDSFNGAKIVPRVPHVIQVRSILTTGGCLLFPPTFAT